MSQQQANQFILNSYIQYIYGEKQINYKRFISITIINHYMQIVIVFPYCESCHYYQSIQSSMIEVLEQPLFKPVCMYPVSMGTLHVNNKTIGYTSLVDALLLWLS